MNPGSEAAINQDCTCPVLDNSHGKGIYGGMLINSSRGIRHSPCGGVVHRRLLAACENNNDGAGSRCRSTCTIQTSKIRSGVVHTVARRSRSAHLKAEIFDCFAQGIPSMEICHSYPEIAQSTIFHWLGEFNSRSTPMSLQKQASSASSTSDSGNNLVLLEGQGELSDFLLARRLYRQVVQNKEEPSALRIQAANGLSKLCLLRQQLPKHILREDEKGEPQQKTERPDYSKMSAEELAKLYREKISKTG
jgi:molecular chaperone DnaK (HSP70)